jgi:hypothetical protein
MSAEDVRAQIDAAVHGIRLQGAVPTMRLALQTYREAYFGTPLYGLTPNDKRAYEAELKRVDWLLTEVFPEQEVSDG